MALRPFFILLAAGCAFAQSVQVYSEFQRPDPFGNIIAADKADSPREILSPALARNAYSSFLVVVSTPPGELHTLFVGQNPEDAVHLAMYRASFVESGGRWIPDVLLPVTIEQDGKVVPGAPKVEGETAEVYWLDLWVDKDAPVRRTRLELQLSCSGRWIIYPMELRIIAAQGAAEAGTVEPLGSLSAPASDSAAAVLRNYACGSSTGGEESTPTIRSMIRRNARQDIAIARGLEPRLGRAQVVGQMLDAIQPGGRESWCRAPSPPPQLGAEWYLRVRGFLYREASRPESQNCPGPAAVKHAR